MPNLRLLQTAIYSAQLNKMILKIVYKKISTKKIINREVEPYEVKEETRKDGKKFIYLYAWDTTKSLLARKRHIKKFRIDQFIKASVGNKTFKPKFDIKLWN